MSKFDSAVLVAALSLVVLTPGFAAGPGATPPNTDTDAVIPGAKAVDEVSGGAIVDPDQALKRGTITTNQPTKQPCKLPTTEQSTNTSGPPCEAKGWEDNTAAVHS